MKRTYIKKSLYLLFAFGVSFFALAVDANSEEYSLPAYNYIDVSLNGTSPSTSTTSLDGVCPTYIVQKAPAPAVRSEYKGSTSHSAKLLEYSARDECNGQNYTAICLDPPKDSPTGQRYKSLGIFNPDDGVDVFTGEGKDFEQFVINIVQKNYSAITSNLQSTMAAALAIRVKAEERNGSSSYPYRALGENCWAKNQKDCGWTYVRGDKIYDQAYEYYRTGAGDNGKETVSGIKLTPGSNSECKDNVISLKGTISGSVCSGTTVKIVGPSMLDYELKIDGTTVAKAGTKGTLNGNFPTNGKNYELIVTGTQENWKRAKQSSDKKVGFTLTSSCKNDAHNIISTEPVSNKRLQRMLLINKSSGGSGTPSNYIFGNIDDLPCGGGDGDCYKDDELNPKSEKFNETKFKEKCCDYSFITAQDYDKYCKDTTVKDYCFQAAWALVCNDEEEDNKYYYYEGVSSKTGKVAYSSCVIGKTDQAENPYIDNFDTKIKDNPYCRVFCKEDWEFDLPGKKYASAGRFFLIDIPRIQGARTCVTNLNIRHNAGQAAFTFEDYNGSNGSSTKKTLDRTFETELQANIKEMVYQYNRFLKWNAYVNEFKDKTKHVETDAPEALCKYGSKYCVTPSYQSRYNIDIYGHDLSYDNEKDYGGYKIYTSYYVSSTRRSNDGVSKNPLSYRKGSGSTSDLKYNNPNNGSYWYNMPQSYCYVSKYDSSYKGDSFKNDMANYYYDDAKRELENEYKDSNSRPDYPNYDSCYNDYSYDSNCYNNLRNDYDNAVDRWNDGLSSATSDSKVRERAKQKAEENYESDWEEFKRGSTSSKYRNTRNGNITDPEYICEDKAGYQSSLDRELHWDNEKNQSKYRIIKTKGVTTYDQITITSLPSFNADGSIRTKLRVGKTTGKTKSVTYGKISPIDNVGCEDDKIFKPGEAKSKKCDFNYVSPEQDLDYYDETDSSLRSSIYQRGNTYRTYYSTSGTNGSGSRYTDTDTGDTSYRKAGYQVKDAYRKYWNAKTNLEKAIQNITYCSNWENLYEWGPEIRYTYAETYYMNLVNGNNMFDIPKVKSTSTNTSLPEGLDTNVLNNQQKGGDFYFKGNIDKEAYDCTTGNCATSSGTNSIVNDIALFYAPNLDSNFGHYNSLVSSDDFYGKANGYLASGSGDGAGVYKIDNVGFKSGQVPYNFGAMKVRGYKYENAKIKGVWYTLHDTGEMIYEQKDTKNTGNETIVDTEENPNSSKKDQYTTRTGKVMPVRLTTKKGIYEYELAFYKVGQYPKGKTGRIIGGDDDNGNNSIFKKLNEEGFDYLTQNYICHFEVKEDLCTCCGDDLEMEVVSLLDRGGECKNGMCGKQATEYEILQGNLGYFSRTISVNDMNPNGRTLGTNWTDEKGSKAKSEIENTAEEIYKSNTRQNEYLEYKFVLSSRGLQELRDATKGSNYAEFDMQCKENGVDCTSRFLDKLKNSNDFSGVKMEIRNPKWQHDENGLSYK